MRAHIIIDFILVRPVEILDFGFPQNSEIDALKMYITTESVKSELAVVRPSGTLCPTQRPVCTRP